MLITYSSIRIIVTLIKITYEKSDPASFYVPSRKEWEVKLIGFDSDGHPFNSLGDRRLFGEYSDWIYAYWGSDFGYMVLDGDKTEPTISFSDSPYGRSINGMVIRCIANY